MKIFLDTNIWLRFLVQDEKNQFEECVRLFEAIENGKIKPYTSAIVLLELQYVLFSVYGIDKKKVLEEIGNLVEMRNLVIIEKTDFFKALSWAKKYHVKFSDCLIGSQVFSDIVLCTYDRDFAKFNQLNAKTPVEVINLLS